MFLLNLTIRNPWNTNFKNLHTTYFQLSANWTYEFEVLNTDELISIELAINLNCDHPGLFVYFAIFGLAISTNIHDNRHKE